MFVELALRFPLNDVMDAMGIFYPQYWLQTPEVYHLSFDIHLETLKQQFSNGDRLISTGRVDELSVEPLVSWAKLNYEAGMFKITMISNAQAAMSRPLEVNPFIALWRTIYANSLL